MKQKKYDDERFMEEALKEAKKGFLEAHPNPMVGCVIVQDNQIIAAGFHQRFGEAHAEVNAVAAAGDLSNATCYVTLEPCSHTGKTPPCADLLVAKRVKRVVVACVDPNPLVQGKGIAKLKAAGIEVTVGVLEHEAQALIKGFTKRQTKQLPQVIAKIAASMDGKTAMSNGESQWITGEQSRLDGHLIRAQVGAIISSYQTVNQDNAKLTARHPLAVKQPLRVIIDTHLKTNVHAELFKQPGKTVIAIGQSVQPDALEKFTSSVPGDCEVVAFEQVGDKINLKQVLHYLAEREVNQVLIEAGQGLLGAMLANRLVDDVIIYYAPKLLGSKTLSMFDFDISALDDHIALNIESVEHLGSDLKIKAGVQYALNS